MKYSDNDYFRFVYIVHNNDITVEAMKFVFYLKYHTRFGERLAITADFSGPGYMEMQYFNDEYWKFEIDIDSALIPQKTLTYRYTFKTAEGVVIDEFQQPRRLVIDGEVDILKIYDTWNYAGAIANTFYTSPFQEVLLPRHKVVETALLNEVTHLFKVKAPLIGTNEVICILGDEEGLNSWDVNRPVLLEYDGEQWCAGLNLTNARFPLAYKYGIYNKEKNEFVRFEDGGNRVCFEPAFINERTILQDGFVNLPDDTWRGCGIAIPVFSLRSKNGLGVGEFTDLKLLVDWAVKTGLKLIQILPVNDTTATHTWVDSYPYAAISAFALHPVYINLEAIDGKKSKEWTASLKNRRKQLNELAHIDYEAVMECKMTALQELFDENGSDCMESQDYKDFFERNRNWLKPYAAFCYLRDKFASPNPADWGTEAIYEAHQVDAFFKKERIALQQVQFYCYIQYQLHLQLSDAVSYAHKKGIVMKGDIPIGVYRYGCDAWVAPELYNMQWQAGAPPDDFAVKGQNWGFPTYNWEQMQQDGFSWWRERFKQMSCYFDAFRIDHILGFFRIWSIPLHAVQGIMGRFDPCIPVHISELGEQGIWFDYERFCMPYITDEILWELFREKAEEVKQQFLQKHGPHQYILLSRFDTQKKVEAYFKERTDAESIQLRNGLYDLISNVILFEQEGSAQTAFHFRIALDQTSSFHHLPPQIREKLWHLYIDYFYRRQNDFWKNESLKKLPRLKAVTNMLVCGEDLGMVPDSVPGVMKQLGILSLEIQRMPKQQGAAFFNPARAPYLSVVTPSTHDMSTIRGWWQEDRNITQQFYNTELGQSGAAPYFCEPWINRAIVLQHLYSPAMWSIFQLQDLLGMSATLRRENPEDERINIPANPQHYWRYRMHLTLEQLLKEKDFNEELKGYVVNSGR
ncbi:4-alpha-glucanotransferase [Niabella aquatica]